MLAWLARRALYRAASARPESAERTRHLWWSRYYTDIARWRRGADWRDLRKGQAPLIPSKADRKREARKRQPRAFVHVEWEAR